MRNLLLIFFCFMLFGSCRTTKTTAYMSYDIQCLGVEGDGSQTLVTWGEGKNKKDAEEQAMKNAVYDVIFKGIHAGSSECNQVPLVNTPNARQKFEDFFNNFFADGGPYLNYVSLADQRRGSKDKEQYQYGEKRSVTVRVLRPQLKEKLKSEGIIPN